MGVKLPEVTFQSRVEKDGSYYDKFVYTDGSIGYKDFIWLTITSPDNTVTVYEYSPDDKSYNKLRVNKPDGTIENYFNDKDNRLHSIIAPDNTITFYENSEKGLVIRKVEGADRKDIMEVLNYNRDYIRHYLEQRNFANSTIYSYSYEGDSDIYETKTTYREQNREIFQQKFHNGRLIKEVDRQNKDYETIKEYYDDEHNRLIYLREGIKEGGSYIYKYNYYHNNEENSLKEIRLATSVTQYAEDGTIIYSEDSLGEITRVDHDDNGRIIEIHGSEGHKEYYGDSYRLRKHYDKNSFTERYYYNNKENNLAYEETPTSVKTYKEDGTPILSEDGLGKIKNINRDIGSGNYWQNIFRIEGSLGYKIYYPNGQVEAEVLNELGRKEYYPNGQVKEEVNKLGTGFTYDEEGNRTTLIFKGKRIPLKNGKLETLAVNIDGDKLLFDKNENLIFHYDSKEQRCYDGTGKTIIELQKNPKKDWCTIVTSNTGDASHTNKDVRDANIVMRDDKLIMFLRYSHTDENWWTDDARETQTFYPDGKIVIENHLWNSKREMYKDGTVIRTNEEGHITSFENKKHQLSFSKNNMHSRIFDALGSDKLYFKRYDGENLEGYIDNSGKKFSCNKNGVMTINFPNGDRRELNLGSAEWKQYNKDGKLTKEVNKDYIIEHVYAGDNIEHLVFKNDRDKILNVQSFENHQLVASYEYAENGEDIAKKTCYTLGKGNIIKVKSETLYDGKDIVKTTSYTYKNDNSIKEKTETLYDHKGAELPKTIKYTYHKDTPSVSSVTVKQGDKTQFTHYDINGNDDTVKYLAIKKVAERQVEKSEKLRQQAEASGKQPARTVVKKLNKLQKYFEMKKAKREIGK